MAKKQLIAAAVGTVVVGAFAYLGYRLFKELDEFDLDDHIWSNIDDVYYYRRPKDSPSAEGQGPSTEPFI
jgi:hypothetical protein